MSDRAGTLERIADLALRVRTLERELVPAADPRRVLDLLKDARVGLDEALRELSALDRRD